MVAPVTVLTVTIPDREELLLRNIQSVNSQSVGVERQLICSQPAALSRGQVQVEYTRAKNAMLTTVTSEWVAVLNDDDYWLPHHIETLSPYLDDGDVVYSWEANGNKPRHDYSVMTQAEQVAHWDETNLLDGNILLRRSVLEAIGGFPTEWEGGDPWVDGHFAGSIARFEDWRMWQLMSRLGARFVCVPVETWCYGMGTPGQICG